MSDGVGRRRTAVRWGAGGGIAVVVVILLAGCFATGGDAQPFVRGERATLPSASQATSGQAATDQATSDQAGADEASPEAGGTGTGGSAGGSTTPDPAISRPATAAPAAKPVPDPTLTPVPRGTVVAQGDVASPKGSIHFHYRMVSNGDNTYSAQYSGFTSTLPVPVSATLLEIAPRIGDGLTFHGVGDFRLGGPTTATAPTMTAPLDVSQPSSLGTLVTYSSASSTSGVPTEIGPDKVLVVTPVRWNVPVRQTNVHPVDTGARSLASGIVTARTPSGAPKRYRIAGGDTTTSVADRFGISVKDLIWLNPSLTVYGDEQYLYEDTELNLDPNSL